MEVDGNNESDKESEVIRRTHERVKQISSYSFLTIYFISWQTDDKTIFETTLLKK